MLGSMSHSALPENLARNVGELYLTQARTEREKGHLDVALVLYDRVKEMLKSLGSVKAALRKAQEPQTLADETLRAMMADAYFERGEVLDRLNLFDKARISYIKAKIWGHAEAKHRVEVSQPLPSGHSAHLSTQTFAQPASEPLQQPDASSAEAKSDLVDYLFEKALLTLSSLEVSKKPTLFLVYAHDNPAHGKAEASTSKYLINKLFQLRGANLFSDQAPTGQRYSTSPEDLEKDCKLEDILTNQLCLLPARLIKDVEPVNKVVVCCSEVLGSYLKWQYYEDFYKELREAYSEDRDAYRQGGKQPGASAIREVVRKFSEEEKYKKEFHHVLTEIAFLQIRAEHLKDTHGIIPVSLAKDSYDYCLKRFIPATTVRMEDISRFSEQAQAGQEVYPNKSRHWVLFKLIERLLISSDEAKTFLGRFWQGYDECISRLKQDSTLGELGFAKLLDGIFDDIRTTLHSQLASIVKQQNQRLWILNADPRAALQGQYFAALKHDDAFNETQQLYVEPRGKATSHGKAEIFDLLSKVKALLRDKQVVLLAGDSGAGKTTLNRVLEKQLWENKKEHDAIPLFISLPSIDKPEHDLIAKALKKRGLSEFQIQALKKEKQKFIFILDGYDEIRQTQNLYLSNRINQSDGWQGQMVISCRSEYLGRDYQSRFQPNPSRQGEAPSFQEVAIEPFSEAERNRYLTKYVEHNRMGWASQRYQAALEQPHLKDLVSNPFLLQVVLEALPYLENEGKGRSAVQLRLDLYEHFVRRWFERNQQRLGTQDLKGAQGEIFRALSDDGFARHGLRFVQDLAVHLYVENGGNPIVEYSLFEDKGNWKEAFFGSEEGTPLLREAWPLIRSGNQYRFIHKSLLEYCVARALFESFDACMALNTRHRRGSNASVYSFEAPPIRPRPMLRDLPLAPKHWIGDLGVMRLLTERVQKELLFKEQLLAIIERSKTDAGVRQLAAHAMTILVKAGVQFNGADLKGIQIPGADLSFGIFDSAQLQGSDLRKVILHTSWLRQANLSGAQMTGVQFGEWPYLQEKERVSSCAYSPDGKRRVVGLLGGKISVYSTSNWEKILTLEVSIYGGSRVLYSTSVVYSPSGSQIASGSQDHTVHLWDAQSGALVHTLKGHTGHVNSVVYSPSGTQIASGSEDTTVRLWYTESGALGHTLEGHTDYVKSVAYSPSGTQIASGSRDKTVRLWDAHSGARGHILEGHTSPVLSVVYSPSGTQIASGSYDRTVRLWNVYSGALGHTLRGHTGEVNSVVYSPIGTQIASGSGDQTVRLWDAESGALVHTLEGHIRKVTSVVYSPSGTQIASGSEDCTVRLWDAESGAFGHTLERHRNSVSSVMYSPSGTQIALGSGNVVQLRDAESGALVHALEGHISDVWRVVYSPSGSQIASGGKDQTVRLWDAESGALGHTLKGHTDGVTSVVYSPSGSQIASGSNDMTVRLWNAQSGALEHILKGHSVCVNSVVYSPIGSQLVVGSYNKVWLWDAESGALRYTLEGRVPYVNSVAYSPSGLQIASGNDGGTVCLWDAESLALERTLRGHTTGVNIVVYSPSGLQLASGSYDKTIRLWEAESGALEHTLEGHTNRVNKLMYSPSGSQLASGSSDKTVRLWDVASGQCRAVIEGFNGSVYSFAWKRTCDGSYLVTGSEDKSVRRWELKKEGEETKVILCWSSGHEALTVKGTLLEGAVGLSERNGALLKQRGAVEKALSLVEAERRPISEASEGSSLKLESNRGHLETAEPNSSGRELTSGPLEISEASVISKSRRWYKKVGF